MELKIRPHQIRGMQRKIAGIESDIGDSHGIEVKTNENTFLEAILENPNINIEITSENSSICHPNCKIKKANWHHCKGSENHELEEEEAIESGLKIGKSYPANKIFSLPE